MILRKSEYLNLKRSFRIIHLITIIMKNYLPLFLFVLLLSCEQKPTTSPESLAMEKEILKCWNKNWVETDGYDITKGITQLDEYLFSKGLLGKRTVEDYRKFFNDTAIVFIPDSVKGSNEMKIALNNEFEGEPNIEGMVRCWETNWFAKMNTLDTSDVIQQTGILVEKLSKAGDTDFKIILDDFFRGMSQEELDRPLIKDIAYFIFWKTRARKTHIQFLRPGLDEDGVPLNSI